MINMNISWSRKILEQLFHEGVREIVFCAGARNSPLVAVLSKSQSFQIYSFYEERSAAFFALGCTRKSDRPVAIITTSGTAAAELLPAIVEAFHTGVPLVAITADRPRRLRGTGAPQSIDQTGLFSKFVECEFDLEGAEDFSLQTWSRRAPIHLNICFDEPLLDEPVAEWRSLEAAAEAAIDAASEKSSATGRGDEKKVLPHFKGTSLQQEKIELQEARAKLQSFLQKSEGLPLVVLGTLETEEEREAVAEFLLRLKAPTYLEGTSGLREDPRLDQISLRSGDRLLLWAMKKGLYNQVLRIGGIPTVRIWRDLEERTCPVEVLSLTTLPFSGLSRGQMICAEITATLAEIEIPNHRDENLKNEKANFIYEKDREATESLRQILVDEPRSEASLIWKLSKLIPNQSLLYVGNSLPIREWDLVACRETPRTVEANRGVNGIDGQISTFLGMVSKGHQENWAILGDLTTLYDLSGPWALSYRESSTVRMAVINNSGGKIFERIFRNSLFENRHALGFESWAKMWGLGYQKWVEVPQALQSTAMAEVIEILPDNEASQRFWDRYDALWV